MNLSFASTNSMLEQKQVRRFQEGGPMGPEGGAPMPEEGGAPMPEEGGAPEQGGGDQLEQVAQQLVDMLMQQVGDPQAVGQILEIALQMVQGGGGAPEPQEPPVYGLGGKLLYRRPRY